jgi:hypothetical protein
MQGHNQVLRLQQATNNKQQIANGLSKWGGGGGGWVFARYVGVAVCLGSGRIYLDGAVQHVC